MSQANRNLVADALESGEFEQGIRSLCRDGQYCCLGVACEIYQRHVGDLVVERVGEGSDFYLKFDGTISYLPEKVRKWLEFTDISGAFNTGSLISLNDNGIPFTEIAKLFRNPPKGLVDDTSES